MNHSLQFHIIRCPSCGGYAAKGKPPNRIPCPSCNHTGIIKIPLLKSGEPEYSVIVDPNCSGYGTKGYARITCPTCNRTGVIKIPLAETELEVQHGR